MKILIIALFLSCLARANASENIHGDCEGLLQKYLSLVERSENTAADSGAVLAQKILLKALLRQLKVAGYSDDDLQLRYDEFLIETRKYSPTNRPLDEIEPLKDIEEKNFREIESTLSELTAQKDLHPETVVAILDLLKDDGIQARTFFHLLDNLLIEICRHSPKQHRLIFDYFMVHNRQLFDKHRTVYYRLITALGFAKTDDEYILQQIREHAIKLATSDPDALNFKGTQLALAIRADEPQNFARHLLLLDNRYSATTFIRNEVKQTLIRLYVDDPEVVAAIERENSDHIKVIQNAINARFLDRQ